MSETEVKQEMIEEIPSTQILKMLPHKYPFVMVDKLKNVVPFERATGIKNVTINEPFFQGHFPEYPVMPGVLQIEAMAQTAGLCVLAGFPEEKWTDVKTLFMTVDNVKFRKPAVPGDVLEIHVEKEHTLRNIYKFSGKVMCGDKVVSEAKFSAMIIQ